MDHHKHTDRYTSKHPSRTLGVIAFLIGCGSWLVEATGDLITAAQVMA